MAKRLRYSGEFLSLSGDVWRCEILQEAVSDYAQVGDLVFPADEPISIEWDERSPEEPVCGSMATLTIESPGDRTYADLYTEVPGAIRLDVYRNNVLYWSGCLDTETYSEPYDRGSHYDVELTFYDFGMLQRIPYNLTGKKTLREILEGALAASGINYGSIDETYTSTKFTDDTAVTLAALSIQSDNFIDEDELAFDWEKVLGGILQPLALKVIQKAGVIWVYDINGLYTKKNTSVLVEWDGVGQRMDTGRVYNNLRVTFSPYSSGKLGKEFKYGDTYGPEYTNLGSSEMVPDRYSYYPNYSEAKRPNGSWDYNLIDFTIFRSSDATKCKGLAAIGGNNRFFKTYPMLGGTEAEGVAVGFYTGGHGPLTTGWPVLKGVQPGAHPQNMAFKTERIYLPPMGAEDQKNNFVRIVMEALADVRYNPFEDAPKDEEGNDNDIFDSFKSFGSMAFVPVDIVLYNANGTALYHYENKYITANGHPGDSIANCSATKHANGTTRDGWKSGNASFGDAWLAYYDGELDLVTGQGVGGWKANRQNFGKAWSEGRQVSKRKLYYYDINGNKQDWWFFESFKKAPDGQFIPYPPVEGYLEIRVYNGIYIFDDLDHFDQTLAGEFYNMGLYQKMRWLLYKAPEVSVVRRTLTFDEAELDDIEYTGVCNPNAQEDLELETICGTSATVCPTAKGILMRTSTGAQLQQLKRAGRTESAEQLLIGTMFSQFATRKTALSGEVEMDPGGLTLYREAAQENGVRLLMASEVQHVREEMSEAELLEVRPDEYTAE